MVRSPTMMDLVLSGIRLKDGERTIHHDFAGLPDNPAEPVGVFGISG